MTVYRENIEINHLALCSVRQERETLARLNIDGKMMMYKFLKEVKKSCTNSTVVVKTTTTEKI